MACTIPNFNLNFKATYDISGVIPSVTIENLSTGDNLANIDYFFVLKTPSGVVYHTGSYASPDASGVWTTINISEPIPQSGGHIEFSNVPYSITAYAKDDSDKICELTKLDIICAPTGNNGKNNYGLIALNILQKCLQGLLQIIDVTNYVWNGIIGEVQGSTTTMVYPADETGTAPANAVIEDKNGFTIPIPINGKGYQLFRNLTQLYTFPSTGNEILIKYKYEDSCLEINCNISLCSVLCGLTKYRKKLTDSITGKCTSDSQQSINDLTLKIAQLSIALSYHACGFDVNTLHAEIKAELLKEDCYCDCNEPSGNNDTTGLECSGIDIACVWNQISILLNADAEEKAKFCNLVEQCIDEMNASLCSQPFMSSVVMTTTTITVNFNLSNTTNSTGLKVYYKLHSSGVWILAATLAANATTYDIAGAFTEGELYDVKVTNECSVGGPTDSVTITQVMPVTMDACYYLELIFPGLVTEGMYGIYFDPAGPDCGKLVPTIIDTAFIANLLPCSIPVNVKINESSLLTWDGDAGDYSIEYKLKTDPSWINNGQATYTGTSHFIDLSGLTLSPLADYEFRVIHNCTGGDSLPIHTEYTNPVVICPSAGDFISFDETTGELLWTGNGDTGATYVFSALSGGSFLSLPLTITLSASGHKITADYSNILAGLGVGDEVTFAVYQDCGGGSTSNIQSHSYTFVGATATCPTFTPGFGYNSIDDDVIIVNPGGATVPNAAIARCQYQLKVNGVFAGTGDLVIDGGYETKVKSLVHIVTGDTVEFRYRSFCNCCDNNVTGVSAWTSFLGTAVTTVNPWDDIWKSIPGGWWLNGAAAGVDGAYYKIDKNGKFWLRGSVNFGAVTPTAFEYPAAPYTTAAFNFLDIATIYSDLAPSTLDGGADTDFWPLTHPDGLYTAAISVHGNAIKRIDNIFSAHFITANSGALNPTDLSAALSGISIQ